MLHLGDPPDCSDMMDLYDDAHLDGMMNHAENEITNRNYSGSWYSNVVISASLTEVALQK